MEIKKKAPWLTNEGKEISTRKLKRIARHWGPRTWGQYLDWYETPRQESLVASGFYKKKCELQTESIFEQFAQSASDANRETCESMLNKLAPADAQVLRLAYFEGRTQRQIAATLDLSQPGVYQAKKRALEQLRKVEGKAKVITRRYMKGKISSSSQEEDSIWDKVWDKPPFQPARNPGRYDAKLHKEEIAKIQRDSVRLALQGLQEDEQRMLYLRHWCCRSINQIARELGMGVNVVDQILGASLNRVKRKIIFLETGSEAGGGY